MAHPDKQRKRFTGRGRTAALSLGVLAAVGCRGSSTAQTGWPEFIRINDAIVAETAPDLDAQRIVARPIAGLMVVPVTINGVKGFEFLLDTGAAATALFAHRKTRALGLKTTGTFPVSGTGDGEPILAKVARDVTIQLGGVTLRNMAPLIIDWDDAPIFASEDGVFIDGVIGYDLFRRFTAEIDVEAKSVRLSNPSPTSDVPDGAIALPLNVLPSRHICATVSITRRAGAEPFAADVEVDTGFVGTLELNPDSHPMLAAPTEGRRTFGRGLQGDNVAVATSIAELGIASLRWPRVPVSFNMGSTAIIAGRHGLLGSALLRHFRYVIDYANERLVLMPPKALPQLSGASFDLRALPAGDRWLMQKLHPMSPAYRAGLRQGDRIRSIGGRPAAEVDIRDVLGRRPQLGDALSVCVERPAGERCFQVIASE